jgi:hypothetical protein
MTDPAGHGRSMNERNVHMFTNIRIFVFIAGGIFAFVIALSVLGNNIDRSTSSPIAAAIKEFYDKSSSTVVPVLFFVLCFAIIPVFIRTFVRLQLWIGNGELGLVKFLQQHECTVTYVVWGIIVVFIVVMLPQIIEDIRNG